MRTLTAPAGALILAAPVAIALHAVKTPRLIVGVNGLVTPRNHGNLPLQCTSVTPSNRLSRQGFPQDNSFGTCRTTGTRKGLHLQVAGEVSVTLDMPVQRIQPQSFLRSYT